MPADKFLPAIGHAVSGAAGTAISTTATYPLDLVNTRIKVQRQLRKDGTISPSEQYRGILDAFKRIHSREGGASAFYAGLGSDVAKSVADSFLFFLFYTWFRSRRSQGNSRRLPAWEELAVGAAAGACARLFTTPFGNVVTRKQTASLIARDNSRDLSPRHLSVAEILHVIRAEKGVLGLWAGYGATLVLTLNPSITFYLQHALKKALVNRGREGESGAVTFLVAAVSKMIATAVTYPFNIAKVRVQVSAPSSPKLEPDKEASASDEGRDTLVVQQDIGEKAPESPTKAVARRLHHLAQETIFATVMRIARTEGVPALYDGVSGELLKAFFNHGTTMLSKDFVHKVIVQLYFFVLAMIRRSPAARALLLRRFGARWKDSQFVAKYAQVEGGIARGTLVTNLLERVQRKLITTR